MFAEAESRDNGKPMVWPQQLYPGQKKSEVLRFCDKAFCI